MFDYTDISQKEISSSLKKDLEKNELPQALLFSGPPFSGKLTAGVELARAMGCNKENLVISATRDFLYPLNTALKVFVKAKDQKSKEFLKNNLEVFQSTFHSVLDVGNDRTKPQMLKINEFYSKIDSLNEDDIVNWGKDLKDVLNDLQKNRKKNNSLSMEQLRNVQSWLEMTSFNDVPKVFILEGLETVNNNVSNGLLKLLEEPNTNSRIVLISTSYLKLLETILSRVRKFEFKEISGETLENVVKSFSGKNSSYRNLESYFLLNGSGCGSKIEKLANDFICSRTFDLGNLFRLITKEKCENIFLKQLSICNEDLFMNGKMPLYDSQQLQKKINLCSRNYNLYNQNIKTSLQALYYQINKGEKNEKIY